MTVKANKTGGISGNETRMIHTKHVLESFDLEYFTPPGILTVTLYIIIEN